MALLLRSRCLLAALATRRINVPAVCIPTVRCPTVGCATVRWTSSKSTGNPSGGTPPPGSEGNPLPTKKRTIRGSPITWKMLVATAGVMGVLLLALDYGKKRRRQERRLQEVKSLGKAAIGGDFELFDSNRKQVSSKDFRGKWMLIYFGFTHCPDICPEELEKMAAVIKAIDEKLGPEVLQPIFVSVDPERDTPEIIGKYATDFSPRLLGLTGTIDDIKDICKKFRIYYSAGPKETDDDYIVDHTIITYLIDPEGEFSDYFSQNRKKDEVVRLILDHMEKYKIVQEVINERSRT